MEKEILTFEKIKKDLKEQRKAMYITLAVFLALLPFSIWMFVLCIKRAAYYGIAIYALIFSVYAILSVVMVASMVVSIVTQNRVLKDKNCIVIDEVTGAEEKVLDRAVPRRSEDGTIMIRFRYIIHFSDYGEYTTFDSSLFNSCRCNDKFYLVLSKPHTGKILLAYNTKRYVLEGEEINGR